MIPGLIASGCTGQKGEGFAIYLTVRENPGVWQPSESPDIQDTPVISLSDIQAYDRNHHWLTLTSAAIERLAQLEVPVGGREFAVCVDREVIYTGAFWSPVSSLSYNGPVIVQPAKGQDSRVLTIELGYPSSAYVTASDPRSDPRILAGLAGRLVG
ncbi:hypothetical protein Dform_02030 [Dehalogenimonas formicexedens]|uniref:Uncharacterized protein n=2 Tax=Dehalogenimonas formicexedens TaxID=1839801 RepID=A0A1P8FA71_9CHLR|nr:hypothetical protein Dform_02030 [Dehalogenimonas formicexedens]